MKPRSLAFGIAIAAATSVGANQPLAVRVSPAVAFAPANLVVRATVEPDADNRELDVVADGSAFYRSSTISLDGASAPKTMQFEFRSLPPGEYEVMVSVVGADGRQRAVARSHVNVIESGAAR